MFPAWRIGEITEVAEEAESAEFFTVCRRSRFVDAVAAPGQHGSVSSRCAGVSVSEWKGGCGPGVAVARSAAGMAGISDCPQALAGCSLVATSGRNG